MSNLFAALQQALEGRYVLERELGRGGMAVVCLAHETALDRHVALKVLPPNDRDPSGRERFLREARIAAKLNHPNIVPIFTVAEAGPFVYFTMAWIKGETLAERLRDRGALGAGETSRIMHEVAMALQHAHEHGVIHRDVKPSNILLEEGSDRPMVADFGLAREITDVSETGAGPGSGTVSFMCPERSAGRPADARSDIYSLGVVGFSAAAGYLPFNGTLREILQHHISTPAPPLQVFGEDNDTTLSRAVGRCLAKEPGERFQTAKGLAEALMEAPDFRRTMIAPFQAFIDRTIQTSGAVWPLAGAGLYFLSKLAYRLAHADWSGAASPAEWLALVLVVPVFNIRPEVRKVIRAGRTRADIVSILTAYRRHRHEEVASEVRQKRDASTRAPLRVVVVGGVLLVLAVLLAVAGLVLRINVPNKLVGRLKSAGVVMMLLAGAIIVYRHRHRNRIPARYWLWFWKSWLGEWTFWLAGLGLPRNPTPAQNPSTAALNPAAALQLGKDLSAASIRRLRACLAEPSATPNDEDRLVTDSLTRMEAKQAYLEGLDPGSVDPVRLAAEVEEIRAIKDGVNQVLVLRGF